MMRPITAVLFLFASCHSMALAEKKRSLLDLFGSRQSPQETANQAQLLEILEAFKPIVAKASEATVWVFDGDQRLALGTILTKDGLILTKASEIEGHALRCQFADGSHARATIERTLPKHDIALLRVKRTGLPVARFTTEAPIPGSLIATSSPDGSVSGVGVVSVGIRDLSGRRQGYLGVAIRSRDGELSIQNVSEGSAAAKAGLQAQDLLLSIDGESFETVQTFADYVSTLEPGQTVRVHYERDGNETDLQVILGSREEAGDLFDPAHAMDLLGGATSKNRTGYPQAWQHDIGLAPFRMGGPVVDLDGRILGINIARSGRVKTYAIPSKLVMEWVEAPTTPIPDAEPGALDQLLRELEEAEQSLKDASKALDALPGE